MTFKTRHLFLVSLLAFSSVLGVMESGAAVPQVLNHQGRIAVAGVNFNGNGQFKFALVDATGLITYWSNDGTSNAGSQPSSHVTLAVTKGLYSVLLGDTTLTNMTALPSSALDHGDVRLRIWFSDGSSRGFQLITPDQRLAATPYALLAAQATSATGFDGSLAGDVTGTQGATSIAATMVTGKALTGYSSANGTITATDTILSAINKLNGNSELKANLNDPEFTGNATGSFVGSLQGNATGFTGSLAGDVTGTQGATSIAATTVTGKALTGYSSANGTITATDTILTAINKLNGNDGLKANLASPNFTGNVTGITASMVGLGNVDNTSDANKLVSAAQQTALNLKANLASPNFTGNVTGITAAMVGLGNVSNTSDASKPVSTAQQTALDLKANLASPSFSGTVTLPAGTASATPLKLTTGTNLSTAVLGSVEFDGNNLYLTTNASSPTRKTVTLTDTGSSSQLLLSNIVAAPVKPVVAWGSNSNGQTTTPSLSGVAAVAAGASHSIALLDAGTVVAWGSNASNQMVVPATATGVTDIAAGVDHNLARKSDGTIVAWGSNVSGKATVPSDITTATKVAAGKDFSLALLANGTLRAWGDNTWGQTTIPSSLTGVTVTAIASGEDHNLALTAAGAVVAWGRNTVGQITVPTAATTGVIAIAAGAAHSLALKSNGTVVAWGWNEAGQCNVPSDLSGVTQIAAGYGFSMALKSNGAPVVWGETADGVPTIPPTATEVTAIAAGARHALALRSDLTPAQVARLDQNNVFTGNVGIQRTPANYALEVNGNAWKSTGSSWLTSSDRRIKTDIESINGALEKIDQVRLVDFRYTADYLAAHPEIEDRRYPNVIAQEFQQVFPNEVKGSGQRLPDGSEILLVDTYPLTIYSAAAIQELHRENQLLKKKLSDQEQRLRKLEEILMNK
jgi:alpha-tubulin suppressor-like RCC1 family protein